MAGEAIVGALRVILGMDTAQFEDGANKASKSVADFGSHMKATFAGVGLERIVERTFDRIVHTFRETIVQAFEFADQMGKMAQKVGISVEELTGLRLAAQLADVDMDTLSKSLGILSKNLVAAASGNQEMVHEFGRLGITARDSEGNIKSVTTVLEEMADKFEHTRDSATKTEIALKLLGRGGKDLIPLLNEGSGSLREMAETAKRMGLVISTETASRVQTFNDQLKIMGLVTSGVANEVVRQIVPALLQMSSQLAATAKSGDLVKGSADLIVKGFKEVLVYTILVTEVFRQISEGSQKNAKALQDQGDATVYVNNQFLTFSLTSGGLAQQILKLTSPVKDYSREVTKAGDASKDAAGEVKKVTEAAKPEELNAIAKGFGLTNEQLEAMQKILPAIRALVEKMLEPIKTQTRDASSSIDTFNKNTEKLQERLRDLRLQALDASGLFGTQLAPGFLSAAAGLKALDGQVVIVRDRLVSLGPAATEFNQAMLVLQGVRLGSEVIDPFTQFEQKLVAINAATEKYPMLAETMRLAAIKAAGDMVGAYAQVAANIVGGFASAFKDLASLNKKYAGAAKALAIAEALVQTFLGATKAFTSTVQFGLPLAFAAAAAATAAGLANVAKISATNFATGGSFKIGGGIGGIDNQLITIKGTPGEMVDIRRPGQERGSGSTVNLTLPARGSVGVDDVRGLIETINGAIRDGYRINLAAT